LTCEKKIDACRSSFAANKGTPDAGVMFEGKLFAKMQSAFGHCAKKRRGRETATLLLTKLDFFDN